MSRIAEALARAGNTPPPVDGEAAESPWEFEPDDELASPEIVAAPPRVERPKPDLAPAAKLTSMFRSVVPDAKRGIPDDEYREKLVTWEQLPSPTREQYRQLGATLHRVQLEYNVRRMMISSALPGEGKTLIACNLALVLSGSYRRRVLLIDADLRRPSVHRVFGLENRGGVSDCLQSREGGWPQPVPVTANLSVIVAGRPTDDPLSIVTTPAMRELVDSASTAYDWVLIDTPPVALLPEAHVLSEIVDRALLVIQAGRTPYDLIKKSIDDIGRDRVLGTVLNRAEASIATPYASAYGSYHVDHVDS